MGSLIPEQFNIGLQNEKMIPYFMRRLCHLFKGNNQFLITSHCCYDNKDSSCKCYFTCFRLDHGLLRR